MVIGWHFWNWQLFETQKSWSNQTFWQPDTESTKVQDDKKRKIIYAGWEGGERRLREIWAVWASTCLPPQTHLVPDNSRSFMPQLEVFCDIAVESESGILVTFILKLVAHTDFHLKPPPRQLSLFYGSYICPFVSSLFPWLTFRIAHRFSLKKLLHSTDSLSHSTDSLLHFQTWKPQCFE